MIHERSVHFPPGETEATFRIGVHKAGEWKIQLKSPHDRSPPLPATPTLTAVTSGTNAPTDTTLTFTIGCVWGLVTDYILWVVNANDSSETYTEYFPPVAGCGSNHGDGEEPAEPVERHYHHWRKESVVRPPGSKRRRRRTTSRCRAAESRTPTRRTS